MAIFELLLLVFSINCTRSSGFYVTNQSYTFYEAVSNPSCHIVGMTKESIHAFSLIDGNRETDLRKHPNLWLYAYIIVKEIISRVDDTCYRIPKDRFVKESYFQKNIFSECLKYCKNGAFVLLYWYCYCYGDENPYLPLFKYLNRYETCRPRSCKYDPSNIMNCGASLDGDKNCACIYVKSLKKTGERWGRPHCDNKDYIYRCISRNIYKDTRRRDCSHKLPVLCYSTNVPNVTGCGTNNNDSIINISTFYYSQPTSTQSKANKPPTSIIISTTSSTPTSPIVTTTLSATYKSVSITTSLTPPSTTITSTNASTVSILNPSTIRYSPTATEKPFNTISTIYISNVTHLEDNTMYISPTGHIFTTVVNSQRSNRDNDITVFLKSTNGIIVIVATVILPVLFVTGLVLCLKRYRSKSNITCGTNNSTNIVESQQATAEYDEIPMGIFSSTSPNLKPHETTDNSNTVNEEGTYNILHGNQTNGLSSDVNTTYGFTSGRGINTAEFVNSGDIGGCSMESVDKTHEGSLDNPEEDVMNDSKGDINDESGKIYNELEPSADSIAVEVHGEQYNHVTLPFENPYNVLDIKGVPEDNNTPVDFTYDTMANLQHDC